MRSLTHTLTNFLLYSEVIFPPLDKIDVNLYTIAPPLHRLVGSFLLILIINLIWMGTLYLTQYYQCLQEHPTEIRSILLFVTSTRIEFSPYRVTQQIFKFCLIFFLSWHPVVHLLCGNFAYTLPTFNQQQINDFYQFRSTFSILSSNYFVLSAYLHNAIVLSATTQKVTSFNFLDIIKENSLWKII